MEQSFEDERLKAVYGDFYGMSSSIEFDADDVPAGLRGIIPYARFWGVSDDCERESLVRAAPANVLAELKSIVDVHDDALDLWLGGDEAHEPSPSDAYVAFSAMRMAADFA